MTAKSRFAAKKPPARSQKNTADRAGARRKTRSKPGAPPKADRVRGILEMMAAGLWKSGVSHLELAELWGLAPNTVESDAAEASRILKRKVVDEPEQEDRRARAISTLESQIAVCVKGGNQRDLVKLLSLLADIVGLKSAQKVEVGGNLGELLQLALTDGGGAPAHPEVAAEPKPIRR